MKGLSQKLKIIAPIGVTLLTLMGFQNCSGVNFEQAPIEQDSKSLSNEVDETNDPLLPVVSTPGISPPESIAPVYQKDIDVSPVSKKEGDLDIALIIDDSYSNVDNISRILSGVNDLVSSLAGKKFILSAFTIDRNSPYHLMTRRTRSTSDGWTISELIDGRPLAQLDSNGDKSQFLSTIQSHLNSIRNKAPGYDTTPSYACELLGYLHNKMVEQMSADKRHVILVISDENMGSPKNLGCLKSSGYKREAAPPRQMVTIPVQHQQRLEGGTFQWASTRINFGVSSCDQLTKEMIDQRLSSPAFRALPNTYTDCRPGTLNSTRITDSKYEYFFTSTGANNQSEPSSSFKDQLNQFYKVIPKTN
ncbi:MAG: hypothetical protein CL676_09695, partial [Bdellovibrionaceae bacterium]|nr:hypothetical protein [Pseudobdellovibrionaceae bacterium]